MANACKLIGHRYHYHAEGRLVRWLCVRGCGETGSRSFATAREARRHAAARNRQELGADGRGRRVRGLLGRLAAALPRR